VRRSAEDVEEQVEAVPIAAGVAPGTAVAAAAEKLAAAEVGFEEDRQ
jgi:hypothetical protein